MPRRAYPSTLAPLLLGLSLSLGSASLAANGHQTSLDSAVLFSRILEIIDKAGTIIPGEGFKSIKIGDPFKKLITLWGPPRNIDKEGTVSYLLSPKTVIHFTGKKNIKTIIVRGKPGSLARVNNGIMFGMSPDQAAARFKTAPDKVTQSGLRYKKIGIELTFGAGILKEIKVYKP
jgi:hypothetical protein